MQTTRVHVYTDRTDNAENTDSTDNSDNADNADCTNNHDNTDNNSDWLTIKADFDSLSFSFNKAFLSQVWVVL